MGRNGSSSRSKHSKKKSLKVSSEGYRKKKSRTKSKKLRHRDDSFSSFSDDESSSSSLNYSSSGSDGEYERKRARSRSRKEIKSSKKRSRRRSVSEDSGEGEDSPRLKKRKRSKKSKKIKKKNKKKKKSKRDVYISSASSDSVSCSTCKDEDSSDDEHGSRVKSRGRSRQRKRDRRDTTKSRTRSSFSPSRSYESESIGTVATENNPTRLKSVITVANLENEEEEDVMKNDELKEETVYDYDDYPSSKSNDSIELDRFISSPDKSSVVKEVNSGLISSNLNDGKEKDSIVSGSIGSEVDNLESILRQKALENLSKFRGGIKTKPVGPVPVNVKPKSDISEVMQPAGETESITPVSQPVTYKSRFTWRRDPSATTSKKDDEAAAYGEPQSSGSQPTELTLQRANLSSTSRVDNKSVNETSKIVVNTNDVDQKSTDVVETPSSASVKEGGSKEQQREGGDNSQFEKKTMSVMRGGEMVQVSYKVYIPNRAPALARRQLKR